MTRRVRWIVERDGERLAEVLALLGDAAPGALADGRVFVDGRRADDAERRLPAGTAVDVTAPRAATPDEVRILAVQGGVVAAYKPPALATEPDRAGRSSLRRVVSRRLGIQESRLHALSRLDVGVSGVVLLATSAEARRRVEGARAAGALRRRYVALAAGAPSPPSGDWTAPVGSRPAHTRYATTASAGGVALLALEPATGRTHQLRVHAAGAGVPLLGDRAYGGPTRLVAANGAVVELRRIALHAAWVELDAWRVVAEVPDELEATWQAAGGDAARWADALAPGLG